MQWCIRRGTCYGPRLTECFILPGIVDQAVVPCTGHIHGKGVLALMDKVPDPESVRRSPAYTCLLAVDFDISYEIHLAEIEDKVLTDRSRRDIEGS